MGGVSAPKEFSGVNFKKKNEKKNGIGITNGACFMFFFLSSVTSQHLFLNCASFSFDKEERGKMLKTWTLITGDSQHLFASISHNIVPFFFIHHPFFSLPFLPNKQESKRICSHEKVYRGMPVLCFHFEDFHKYIITSYSQDI